MDPSTQMIPRYKRDSLLLSPSNILREVIRDLWSQSTRVWPNLNLLYAAQDTLLNGGLIDDRKYLVEYIIQIAASLPNDSKVRSFLNAKFIHSLWANLQHPPLSYLGNDYKYRKADGSNNNITYSKDSATLGVTGSRYAQTVPPKDPPRDLPDPGLIFDKLLARNNQMKPHPTSVSSSLFHFATIITHDIFSTSLADPTKSDTSSYLDLSPLYGVDEERQRSVRTFEGGKLKNDTFAEWRLAIQPPGVCALLVAFNRYHNYIADELLIINENGRFTLQADIDHEEAKRIQDNDLFQTARLVTCGLYVNIVMNDYLRTILNLNRNPVKSDWKLDPREDFNKIFDKEGTPRGIGNQVTVEFNVIYRWHSCISEEDEAWTVQKFEELLGPGGQNPPKEFYLQKLREFKDEMLSVDPITWKFDNMPRQSDGSFKTDKLVEILQASTDNVAGSFGARNIPNIMKPVEMMGIERGRREWGLTSLNEFRRFFNLAPYTSFTQVNPDREIAKTLQDFYEHPDNIELYPGLIAEATKAPMVPGSGLCPGFTTSFAILSDAVALVRGDRFYAVDFNPQNLTHWGYKEAHGDFDVAGGGVMHKLFKTAFPGWYTENSVYAKYPFTTPPGNMNITDKDLDFNPPTLAPKSSKRLGKKNN